MKASPRVLPVGDTAVTVELGTGIDPALAARVRALDRALAREPFRGLREAVPSYRALLVHYDPRVVSFEEVRQAVTARSTAPAEPEAPARHVVPTRYGGEDGPDLAEVARARGLSESQVVALHAAGEYTAFMLGFTPGFAYLGLLPPELEMPRRATPRPRVAAGSVAIAGGQTAVYPAASPGGWHLLGRTSLRLFDPSARPPALIQPGDGVRFVPVDTLPEPVPATCPPPVPAGPAALEVLDPGLLTTVQDAGRFGCRRWGVAWAGAMDDRALAVANLGLGNPAGAAGLECTVNGPTLRFYAPTRFAVAGADLGAVLQRSDLGAWPVPLGIPVLARAGNVLSFTGRNRGCRGYVALAGGVDVPEVLGSRSTDLAGGFGGLAGRPLRAGDRLSLGGETAGATGPETVPTAHDTPEVVTLRVVLGPQDDHFTEDSLGRFLSEEYTVQPTSDRVGCRLEGLPLTHRGPAEIVSDGLLPGCVQVPPDGRPIVMGADSPTTGGYPKIASVVSADWPLLAQLLPGQGRVRFQAVTLGQARQAMVAP